MLVKPQPNHEQAGASAWEFHAIFYKCSRTRTETVWPRTLSWRLGRDYRSFEATSNRRKGKFMSCTSNVPSCSLREREARLARLARWRLRGLAALTFATLFGGSCSGNVAGVDQPNSGSGGTGMGQIAGNRGTGADNQPAGSGGSQGGEQPGTGSGTGTGTGGSGTGTGGVPSKGGVMLRMLTQAEYSTSIQALLGTITAQMPSTTDSSVAGFVSVGAAQLSVTDTAAPAYATGRLAAAEEVCSDSAR